MTHLSRTPFGRYLVIGVFVSGIVASAMSTRADDDARSVYIQTNLVSNLPGQAQISDPNLQNAWGLAFAPGGPFWVNDNNAGLSTLYLGNGTIVDFPGTKAPFAVVIPGPNGSGPGFQAAPTGIVWNPTNGFTVTDPTTGTKLASNFIFDTEDGRISAWAFALSDNTHAVLLVDNSAVPNAAEGAVYKGLAFGTNAKGNFIFATNFRAGTVETYDQNFKRTKLDGSFTDPSLPAGFAPFGIRNIDGDLFVTYAKQDGTKHDDVEGAGSGFVDVFDTDGHLLRRFATRGLLNSPWGVTRSSYGFGQFSGDVLIGNFGDGRINVYDSHGHFLDQLEGANGKAIVIDKLWTLSFGGGAVSSPDVLYFTAGPNDEKDGLFGKITPAAASEDHDTDRQKNDRP
ncbi:MAG TPA: TIGR03118 family protein [Myxococcota bacterium]|nr:TIGR03118 family protein [Myxococcota bacterium]